MYAPSLIYEAFLCTARHPFAGHTSIVLALRTALHDTGEETAVCVSVNGPKRDRRRCHRQPAGDAPGADWTSRTNRTNRTAGPDRRTGPPDRRTGPSDR